MKRFITCIVVGVLLSQTALAQEEIGDLYDLSLEELLSLDVVSGSKRSEKQTDAPGVIQVITAEEIDRFGALNLAEVLDRVTGAINMGSYTFSQNVTSVRGDLANEFDTHVLLLLNDRPMRESVYGGLNQSIYTAFPLSIIERIEVIRGPGSVLYGSNAYSGVVNIITKQEEGFTGTAQVRAGSFETTSAAGHINYAKDDFHVLGGFSTYYEEGWEFTATDIAGVTNTVDYLDDNHAFTLNTGYKNLTLDAIYTQSEQRTFATILPFWEIPNLTQVDKVLTSKRAMVNLGYDLEFSETVNTSLDFGYNAFRFEPPNSGDQNGGGTGQGLSSDDLLFEMTTFFTPSEKFTALVGGTIYQQNGDIGTGGDYSNGWYSGYAQLDYRPIDQLKLILGGQFNSIEGLESDFVPRVGAVYNFTEKLGAKALWGQSFRAPYAVETSVNLPGVIIGNPDLEAEKLSNLDVQLFYTTSNLELYLTYFDYKSANLITQAQATRSGNDPTLQFYNLNESGLTESNPTGRGVEFEFKYVPNLNWYFTGSYSYQHNEVDIVGITLDNFTYMPNTMIKFGANYQTSDKAFSLGIYNNYVSTYNDDLTQIITIQPVNSPLQSMNLLSANLNFNLTKLFKAEMEEEVILNFYSTNLLDEEVNYPDYTTRVLNSFPGRSGRAIYGSVIVNF